MVGLGVKEEIIFRDLPSSSQFSFRMEGTTLSRRDDGGLETSGAFAGKWEVSPPVVLDKHGSIVKEAAPRFVVKGDTVTLTVSDRWRKALTKADLPVVLDPSVTHAWAAKHEAYQRNANDDGYSTCAHPCQPQVGIPDGAGQWWRPWRSTVHFPYESLWGAHLTDVQVVLSQIEPGSNTAQKVVKVYGGDVNGAYGGDWNWSNLGALLATADVTADLNLHSPAILNYCQGLINQGLPGMPLKFVGDESQTNTYKRWFYFEVVFDGNRAPSVAVPVPPSPGNGDGINTMSPDLKVHSVDPDGDSVEYQFKLCTNPDAETGTCQTRSWSTDPTWNRRRDQSPID